ncbi:sulfotransferase family protein [Streptomyces cacaoi]|uniref:Sulfotransferase family protein n=1 Tax=Streptomyces cacaoi TaxID=1898 RepID=A0A4Y3R2C7_STRCI|nr:sulfotransferase family protein [Streptomyces cacaoi]NNG85501.1 sulfotransferase family protein [Streptomyces cacaoi]GEB50180.1 sulfotransferase family protein [Streptomyces cacaoi]
MDVIGAGYGRTGTLSMQAALKRLGFDPCHHMAEVITNPRQMPLWQEALAQDPVDVRRVFEGYRATVDFPGCVFWRELMEAWPEAKVVLTVRDPHRWYESTQRTIFSENRPRPQGDDPEAVAFHRFLTEELLPRVMDVGSDRLLSEMDEREAVETFNRHIEEVKATVPAERLLVFQVSEGWEPLCEFLDVPVPDEEFPRINEAAGFQELTRQLLAERQRALAAAHDPS